MIQGHALCHTREYRCAVAKPTTRCNTQVSVPRPRSKAFHIKETLFKFTQVCIHVVCLAQQLTYFLGHVDIGSREHGTHTRLELRLVHAHFLSLHAKILNSGAQALEDGGTQLDTSSTCCVKEHFVVLVQLAGIITK